MTAYIYAGTDIDPILIIAENLINKFAKAYNVNKKDIFKSRHMAFGYIRQSISYILKMFVKGSTLERIGAALGCHHATVFYSIKQVESWKRQKYIEFDTLINIKNELNLSI